MIPSLQSFPWMTTRCCSIHWCSIHLSCVTFSQQWQWLMTLADLSPTSHSRSSFRGRSPMIGFHSSGSLDSAIEAMYQPGNRSKLTWLSSCEINSLWRSEGWDCTLAVEVYWLLWIHCLLFAWYMWPGHGSEAIKSRPGNTTQPVKLSLHTRAHNNTSHVILASLEFDVQWNWQLQFKQTPQSWIPMPWSASRCPTLWFWLMLKEDWGPHTVADLTIIRTRQSPQSTNQTTLLVTSYSVQDKTLDAQFETWLKPIETETLKHSSNTACNHQC